MKRSNEVKWSRGIEGSGKSKSKEREGVSAANTKGLEWDGLGWKGMEGYIPKAVFSLSCGFQVVIIRFKSETFFQLFFSITLENWSFCVYFPFSLPPT